MRILTPLGFFSIVRKPEDAAPGLPTVRARAPQAAVARAIGALVAGIGCANFNDAVAARQGHGRAEVYHGVWSAPRRLENR